MEGNADPQRFNTFCTRLLALSVNAPDEPVNSKIVLVRQYLIDAIGKREAGADTPNGLIRLAATVNTSCQPQDAQGQCARRRRLRPPAHGISRMVHEEPRRRHQRLCALDYRRAVSSVTTESASLPDTIALASAAAGGQRRPLSSC